MVDHLSETTHTDTSNFTHLYNTPKLTTYKKSEPNRTNYMVTRTQNPYFPSKYSKIVKMTKMLDHFSEPSHTDTPNFTNV